MKRYVIFSIVLCFLGIAFAQAQDLCLHVRNHEKEDLPFAYIYVNGSAVAITRNPQDNMPRYNLAIACLHSGRTDEASGILYRLVQEYPDNSLFRIGLAKLLCRNGDFSGSTCQYARRHPYQPRDHGRS